MGEFEALRERVDKLEAEIEQLRAHLGSSAEQRARWFAVRAAVAVAKVTGIAPGRILGRDGSDDARQARAIAYWLSWQMSHCKLADIARAWGRNHSTVKGACARVHDAMQSDRSRESDIIKAVSSESVGGGPGEGLADRPEKP